ncbi:unnamed protein product [Arctia plantaginis]|uniref:GDP-D-glucose phosphorylase 1 n=1 Tax=Arctia plantaginis TaxID=874455 RepID=A0A8S1AWS6_ARCPL|nr:unnamed protein product [Arctia plantaginis]
MNLKLVKFIQNNPNIWNPNHPKYTSVEYRDQTYANFANKYGNEFTGQAVKDRWTNIRSTFANYLRKLNASRTKEGEVYKVKWHLWEACSFLLNVNKRNKLRKSTAECRQEEAKDNVNVKDEELSSYEDDFCNNSTNDDDSTCQNVANVMFKISNFYDKSNSLKFLNLMISRWDELHNDTEVFRYKIDKLEERFVNEKYLILLNPDRNTKRRAPEEMNNICQQFDKNKFNFTKVPSNEILFSIEDKGSDVHTVLVNVSPISRYHSLLCPSVNKCLPQVVTVESLALAVEIMFIAENRNLRILFNSLCGFASVNHLHYHLFIEENDFYVEKVTWQHVNSRVYRLDETYPVPAFCFEVQRHSILETTMDIYKVLEYFLKNSIAHNILLTRRHRLDAVDDAVKVIIWPRKSTTGAKQFSFINVAVLELSGWFSVHDEEHFKNLTAEDLEKELMKWKLDDFDKICEDIKQL